MSIEDIIKGLEPDLEEIKKNLEAAVLDYTEDNDVRRMLLEAAGNTGKMIRPLFMLLAAGEYEREDRQELIASAVGLEMVHTSSLILDDMIDASPLRRGCPSIWAEYGMAPALYAGDYLLVSGFCYLQDKGYFKSAGELMRAGLGLCNGEILQYGNLHNTEVDIKTYIRAVKGKTALLFRTAGAMACRITEKDEESCRCMAEFGEILGIMFQIRDDLHDWTKETPEIGKPVNEDFKEGIYTLPALYTFGISRSGEELKKLALKDRLGADDLKSARDIVKEAGGIEYTENYLEELAEKAVGISDVLPDSVNKAGLTGLVRLVTGDGK